MNAEQVAKESIGLIHLLLNKDISSGFAKERSKALCSELLETGAGSRILISESEKEGAMPDKETSTEVGEEELQEDGAKDVVLAETGTEPGETEASETAEQEAEKLEAADVLEILGSTNLPAEIQEWLAESEYADKGELATAVEKAVERVKAITGSGNVVGMGESAPAPETNTPMTEEQSWLISTK